MDLIIRVESGRIPLLVRRGGCAIKKNVAKPPKRRRRGGRFTASLSSVKLARSFPVLPRDCRRVLCFRNGSLSVLHPPSISFSLPHIHESLLKNASLHLTR